MCSAICGKLSEDYVGLGVVVEKQWATSRLFCEEGKIGRNKKIKKFNLE